MADRLAVGLAEVLASALVLGEQHAFPEEVDEAVAAAQVSYRLLETGHMSPRESEDFEELIPESFGLGVLAIFRCPFLGECQGARADFIP
mgnify:CR=1 FL=1